MDTHKDTLRRLRLFRLHSTVDLVAELNLCTTDHVNTAIVKRAVDLMMTIEQRQGEILDCPCDDSLHWF